MCAEFYTIKPNVESTVEVALAGLFVNKKGIIIRIEVIERKFQQPQITLITVKSTANEIALNAIQTKRSKPLG